MRILAATKGGIGDYYSENCGNNQTGFEAFLSWIDPLCYQLGKDVSQTLNSGYGSAPLPKGPGAVTAITPNGGTDAAGNPTYDITVQTPQETQAQNAAAASQFFGDTADSNATDCTAWYNQLANPDCGGSPLIMWGLLGLGAYAAYNFFKK